METTTQHTFTIQKRFLIDWCLHYYKTFDPSYDNPIKMLKENEALDDEMIFNIYKELKHQKALVDFFILDLWLNGIEFMPTPNTRPDKLMLLFLKVKFEENIPMEYRGTHIRKYATIIFERFKLSNLSEEVLTRLFNDAAILSNKSGIDRYSKIQTELVKHKNYNDKVKDKFYELTDDMSYLGEEISELFDFS